MLTFDCDQRSDEWRLLRCGMPTASEFSKLVTSTGTQSKSLEGYAAILAAELFAGGEVSDFDGTAYTDRGKELEPEALAWYAFDYGCDVQPVGFITDDDKRYGCSPDGLIGDDGMIEVKCLKAENHIKAILRFQKDGTSPPDYVQQTQGQMMIAERKWCDLLFYHPALPPLVVRQSPVKPVLEGLGNALEAVLTERDRVHAELLAFASPPQNLLMAG